MPSTYLLFWSLLSYNVESIQIDWLKLFPNKQQRLRHLSNWKLTRTIWYLHGTIILWRWQHEYDVSWNDIYDNYIKMQKLRQSCSISILSVIFSSNNNVYIRFMPINYFHGYYFFFYPISLYIIYCTTALISQSVSINSSSP